ncbi:siderophore ABC transporter substrate-binding protein [Paenibacillus agaridevorans]|uniref:siderophore ABC transporter substrate-binding protein n=1 Tax=Paenibacillus agaridevorans TaxID=171404 RepID=UPI001BE45C2A|nr:siderophore ABC transporter substrate-binding protein [Paenibacillus agaridevorans]
MKKWKLVSAITVMSLMLAACGGGNNNEGDQNASGGSAASNPPVTEQPTANNGAADASAPAYPMTISSTIASTENEEKGTIAFPDVTFEKMPEKIVVFDYGFLDTLDALGVEGVVGLAKDSSLPAHLKHFSGDEYTNIGTLKTPLFEDIAELDPDVIFISGRQSTFYEELKEIADVVFVGTQQNDYWNTFLASVDIAAKMFGKEAEADEYLAKFDEALKNINTLAGNYETSLVTMYNEGNLSGFASNSRFGYMYEVYGFKPVTDDIEASSHGSNFGFEAVLEFNPEVLLVIDRTAATAGNTSNIEADMENAIIKKTKAYQNNRIVYLDGPLWYLGGGGLQSELAKIEEVLAELK